MKQHVKRVTVERYEDDGPDRILVYGTDENSEKVCFHVVGPHVATMKRTIDEGKFPVEVKLPERMN